MILTESETEKVYIKDIFKSFKGFYWKNQLDTREKKRGRSRQQLTYRLYRQIIYKYLEVYFNELYFGNNPAMYFFLGGKMQLAKSSPKKSHNRQNLVTDFSILLFWFLRPHATLWRCVKLKKLTGSSNIITKLDKRFALVHDLLLLPKISQLVGKALKEKTLYRK